MSQMDKYWEWAAGQIGREVEFAVNRAVDEICKIFCAKKVGMTDLLFLDPCGVSTASAVARVGHKLGCQVLAGHELASMDMFLLEEEIERRKDKVSQLVYIEDADHWEAESLDRLITQLVRLNEKGRIFMVMETNLGESLFFNVVSSEFVLPQVRLHKVLLLKNLDLGSIFFPKDTDGNVSVRGVKEPVAFHKDDVAFLASFASTNPTEFKRHLFVLASMYFEKPSKFSVSYKTRVQDRLGAPDLFGPAVEFFRASKTEVANMPLQTLHEITRAMYGPKKKSKIEECIEEDEDEGFSSKMYVPLDTLMEKFDNQKLAESLAVMEFLGLVKQPGLAELVQSDGRAATIRIRKCYTDTKLVDEEIGNVQSNAKKQKHSANQ